MNEPIHITQVKPLNGIPDYFYFLHFDCTDETICMCPASF